MIICRETYSTNRVILKGRIDAFDHLECGLRLRRWLNKAGNLWSDNNLHQVSRAIVCDLSTGLPLDGHSLRRILEAFRKPASNSSWW